MMTAEEALLSYRKAHFAVKVTASKHPEEPEEINLSITHNGFQWTTINLLKSEAEKVVVALQSKPTSD